MKNRRDKFKKLFEVPDEARMGGGLRRGAPEGIGRVIMIHSGKGGVGKTFVTVNLAQALAAAGKRVGILDADIDCPNVMKMMKLEGKMVANENRKIVPLERDGVKVVSMAPLLGNGETLLWRGPRTSRAVEQFVHDTEWGALDFLLVDTPPGTGDVPISVLQILGSAEMVLVTTPQELALEDARRSFAMAGKMDVQVIGLVENMAGEVFGSGGGEQLAKELGISFLGRIGLGEVADFSGIALSI